MQEESQPFQQDGSSSVAGYVDVQLSLSSGTKSPMLPTTTYSRSASRRTLDLNIPEDEAQGEIIPDKIPDEPHSLEFQPLKTVPSTLTKSPEATLGKRKMRESLTDLKDSTKKLAKFQRDLIPASPRPPVSDAEVQQSRADILAWKSGINHNQCPHPDSIARAIYHLFESGNIGKAAYETLREDLVIYSANFEALLLWEHQVFSFGYYALVGNL